MARATNRLTAVQVRQTKDAGRYHDGAGLYLSVDPKGNKNWQLRLTLEGRATWLGLGAYPATSLAVARQKAQERKLAAAKGDVAIARGARQGQRRGELGAPTFAEAFEIHFREHVQHKLVPRYAREYGDAVHQYLMPSLGQMPVDVIESGHIIAALNDVWRTAPTRARKVAQRATRVFKWSIAMGHRRAAEPVGPAREVLGRGRPRIVHRPALNARAIPEFYRWLQALEGPHISTRLLIEMCLFTCLRSIELRLAKWGEIDWERQLWHVPGMDPVESRVQGMPVKRMKHGDDHTVPLCPEAMDVLRRAIPQRLSMHHEALIFPSRRGAMISENTAGKLLRENTTGTCFHGLRATCRTWCSEHGVRHEVGEAMLAHRVPDLTVAAYDRATHLDARREAHERWAEFVTTGRLKVQ